MRERILYGQNVISLEQRSGELGISIILRSMRKFHTTTVWSTNRTKVFDEMYPLHHSAASIDWSGEDISWIVCTGLNTIYVRPSDIVPSGKHVLKLSLYGISYISHSVRLHDIWRSLSHLDIELSTSNYGGSFTCSWKRVMPSLRDFEECRKAFIGVGIKIYPFVFKLGHKCLIFR